MALDPTRPIQRALERNGKFNAVRIGQTRRSIDIYHRWLSITWKQFLGTMTLLYLIVNGLFAMAYVACGPDALEGATRHDLAGRFYDAFFFSVQTFATIGYGKLTPSGLLPNLIVSLEALVGLMAVAVATGILFARFSRPTAKLIFSDRALITNFDGQPSFTFRLANERRNQIVEARISVIVIYDVVTEEGEVYRDLIDLPLVRDRSPVLAVSWTVEHSIDEKSPFYKADRKKLEDLHTEIIVSLTGTDDTFGQTVHSRFSYLPSEIEWDRYYEDIMSWNEAGVLQLEMSKIHDLKPPRQT
ncbi:MAG: ATP-sensitive inward rectifier potassium channel 10 [Methylotenera sp.]|nr:ATP-sensitive inward rectifier potassium channel 10 [Oligoflexia bacterium]